MIWRVITVRPALMVLFSGDTEDGVIDVDEAVGVSHRLDEVIGGDGVFYRRIDDIADSDHGAAHVPAGLEEEDRVYHTPSGKGVHQDIGFV